MPGMHPTQKFLNKLMDASSKDSPEEIVEPMTTNQRRFVEAYARTGTLTGASRSANVDRSAHYRWCRESAAYRAAFIQSELESRDAVLTTCRKVALEDENVSMLIHLSRGMFPEMFGTNRHELSGPNGGHINVKSNNGTVNQLLERIHVLIQQRAEAADAHSERSRLLDGPEDELADTEE